MTRTPRPETGTKPVSVSSRRIRATVACAVLVSCASRSCRPTLRSRSRDDPVLQARDRASRSAVICRTSVARLASLTLALREVCTAAIVDQQAEDRDHDAPAGRGADRPRGGRGASRRAALGDVLVVLVQGLLR